MIRIDCDVLERLGLWQMNDCCGGCHADEIEGFGGNYDWREIDGEEITTNLCCGSRVMGTVDTLRDVIERLKGEEKP